MTLADLLLKLETIFAGSSVNELYLLRGLLMHKGGLALVINKLDKAIVYNENLKIESSKKSMENQIACDVIVKLEEMLRDK